MIQEQTSLAIDVRTKHEAGRRTVDQVLDLIVLSLCAALLLQLDVVAQRRRGDAIQTTRLSFEGRLESGD